MKQQHGFSLLELSIVLVIIGLIAGGIVAGASMIRAAELRSVITEFNQYQTAVHTFRDKYLGLPGDLKNAEDFWGTMSTGTCPAATAGTGTQTCNGDGDGIIAVKGGAAPYEFSEGFGFWQQLANAELVSGTFTGRAGSYDGDHSLIGINVPTSKMNGAGWSVHQIPIAAISRVDIYEGNYGKNTFEFGGESIDGETWEPIMTSTEAWNIDKKIDDGKPGTGDIRARERHTECTDTGTSSTLPLANIANYLLTSDTVGCTLFLIWNK